MGHGYPPQQQSSQSAPSDVERAVLLPARAGDEDDDGERRRDEEIRTQLEYRQRHRFAILALVALTPAGVKFFKAAQSSFEEYLMNDPRVLMSATTYSLMLSLMSLPLATLVGGAMLDYKAKRQRVNAGDGGSYCGCCPHRTLSSRQSCLGTSRTPSYSAIFFLGISLLGIIVYGYGLEFANSIPLGMVGAAVFGLGEGCVVVASRTFVAHAFYGSDGAFAQGVLVAMNNLAMMASKISLPWLIEDNNKRAELLQELRMNRTALFDDDNFYFEYHAESLGSARIRSSDGNSVWTGIVACCAVQLLSLVAGVAYAWWFGLAPPPQSLRVTGGPPQEPGQPSSETCVSTKREKKLSKIGGLFTKGCFEKLPPTFWIVAVGRAIFVVVFKVFTRNSNSFLMEKFGVSAITAGRKSSFHELFALGSPVVGFLAYRSPGGIVPVLLFAAALASVSIAAIACLPAAAIQLYLPGGVLAPIIGISIAHGIFIPICMAIIPQTCAPEQLGMAFAVVEVLGSAFNLTNILFGWLRDATGNYEVPMELLLLYTIVGMCLLWISRNNIRLKQPHEG